MPRLGTLITSLDGDGLVVHDLPDDLRDRRRILAVLDRSLVLDIIAKRAIEACLVLRLFAKRDGLETRLVGRILRQQITESFIEPTAHLIA